MNQAVPGRGMTQQPWYPWVVALLAMLTVVGSNGMSNSGLTVFDESLLNEFQWSVGELKVRDSINFFGAALLVFFAGWMMDRVGFKPLLLTGLALLCGVYLAYPFAESLLGVYALHCVLALVVTCSGNLIALITAATWMPQRRGLAVGIAVAGTSIGGMIIPPLAATLNQALGWRSAMQWLAIYPAVIFVLVALLIRPRKVAQRSDPSLAEGLTFGQAARTPQFTLVAIAGVCTFYAILALYSHLFLYLRSLEFEPVTAALGLTVLSALGLTGKLGAGWASDLVNPYHLIRFCMVLMLTGLAIIVLVPGAIWVGLALTGLGWGSLHTLYNYLLLDLFGMRAAGRINGFISAGESLGGALGIALSGFLFDKAGDYSLAFGVMLSVMALGTLSTLRLRPVTATRQTVGVG